ncbi:MAG TPA: NAD-dependent epimerase/dehydratase family protein [Brevefilum sp.]|nr:NAD-dependent epimerase/dehydratase family protein [Porticoccaceae bacterium]HOE69512.1 NAD-dependent epimerase/dehydratase family protein [Brevefilum sp.]HOR18738.1 NAD-dependent epimerase/dehydratase family protein [Brevefilum sp.]HPL68639.1 NAD-dependent epimerase/dehydratase family protein [Brevefilum sp.]
MNFLITGGAGFLGAALSNRLLRQGHHVRVLDDLSTGNPDALDPEVHFTRGDINDRPKLWTLLQDIDCVYHMAARVSVPESILFPRDYTAVNVAGTVNLMEAARDAGTPKVVLASSGAVYGEQKQPMMTEDLAPHPGSPYAVSKLSAEWYVRTIGALSGIQTLCLRIFNAYGPGQHIPVSHPPVIPNFIRQSLQNGTLVFHGDANQTRDYVYVDDVVNALVAAASAQGINGMVINVGSGSETSIRDLANVVIKVTGGNPEEVYNTRISGGVSRMCADLTLAKEKLDYIPLVPLEMGIRLTLEHNTQLKNGL